MNSEVEARLERVTVSERALMSQVEALQAQQAHEKQRHEVQMFSMQQEISHMVELVMQMHSTKQHKGAAA